MGSDYTPMCYTCGQSKEWVSERWECVSDECARLVAGYEADKASGRSFVYFGMVPGGAAKEAWRVNHEKKFKNDMETYARARKAGLQPNQVSREAVYKAEAKAEIMDKVEIEQVPMETLNG